MLFCEKTRTHQEVCNIFNNIHPNREPITYCVTTKTLWNYNGHGSINNLPKRRRNKSVIYEDNNPPNIALEENHHLPTTKLKRMHDISRRSVGKIINKNKYNPQEGTLWCWF